MPDALALVAAIVFAIVSANGRDETLGSGRDQQIYAEAAVALWGVLDRLLEEIEVITATSAGAIYAGSSDL